MLGIRLARQKIRPELSGCHLSEKVEDERSSSDRQNGKKGATDTIHSKACE